MKITRIQITNFLGIRSLDVALDTPVVVFAGANGAGKSSIHDAIRFAFFGDCARARLKKDHGDLVAHGAKSGGVKLETSEGIFEAKVKGSMKGIEIPDALPYVLDAQRFAQLDPKARRTFLSSLLGVSAKPEQIAQMVAERGCDAKLYEVVKPMLRSGFEAAHQDCKSRATEAKGAWKSITSETWGSAKGEEWEPDVPDADTDALASEATALREDITTLDDQIAAARLRAGQVDQQARMKELAARVPEIEHALSGSESTLAHLRHKAEQLREAVGPGGQISKFTCPDCGSVTRIIIDRGNVVAVPDDLADPVVDAQALTAVRAEIAQVEHMAETKRRELAQAQHAAETLKEASDAGDTGEDCSVEDLKATRDDKSAHLDHVRAQIEGARRATEAKAKAAEAHRVITAWLTLADAFAPDGIPGELLARTIKPINDRLRESAEATGWPQVAVDASMTITADGRRYELLSESEQWRCDAMVAESIAHLSGLRMLVLDRMDVLDLGSRGACLKWLSGLGGKAHDTIIVMATLKAAPTGFAGNVTGLWLESGRLAEGGRQAA